MSREHPPVIALLEALHNLMLWAASGGEMKALQYVRYTKVELLAAFFKSSSGSLSVRRLH